MKGGKRPNSGRKPRWDVKKIQEQIDGLSDLWWERLEQMLDHKDMKVRMFAMAEFNKLQVKALPTKLAGDKDSDPIQITWKSKSTISQGGGQKSSTNQ